MESHHNTCSPDAFAPGRPQSMRVAAMCVIHLIAGVAAAFVGILLLALFA